MQKEDISNQDSVSLNKNSQIKTYWGKYVLVSGNINYSILGKAQLIMYGTFMKNLFLCQHIPTTSTLFGFKLYKSSTNLQRKNLRRSYIIATHCKDFYIYGFT